MKSARIFFSTAVAVMGTALLGGCETRVSPVPRNYVNFSINLNDPAYNGFVVGTRLFITGGSSGLGIVLYRLTYEQVLAYDRMCTSTTHSEWVKTQPTDESAVLLECPNCHSRFSLLDGSVNQGPAEFYLSDYDTRFNPTTGVLWISN